MTRTCCVIAVTLAVFVLTIPALPAEIVVDADTVQNRIHPLHGVNAGPGHVPGWQANRDVIDLYRMLKIPIVRTHDYYGPSDLKTIFPNGWSADPDDPANYDFSETDAVVDEIEAAGCAIMFRLGESWNTQNPRNEIPEDFDTVARVSEKIVERYHDRVAMWEIWNEPNINMFWDQHADPDMEQFADMYATVAKHLKQRWPDLVVGGPGMAGAQNPAQEAAEFAEACRDRGAPLDFYSWHWYNRQQEGPYCLARLAGEIRQALDDEGFTDTVNIQGEWNTINPHVTDSFWRPTMYNADGAAWNAAALVYLHQHSDVRHAFRYRGDCHGGDTGHGLVRPDGSLKKPGYALKAYSMLFADSGDTLMLKTSGGDLEGTAALATTDEQEQAVNVLITRFTSADEAVTVRFEGLPQSWQRPVVRHFVTTPGPDWLSPPPRPLKKVRGGWVLQIRAAQQSGSDVHLLQISDRNTPGP
ncbi:MAG: hypothetical protein R6V19_17745 [Armatimonadota bacterium]